MVQIVRQAIVPYSPAQLYALINDVDQYPLFLSGCEQTKVHSADADHMQASLILKKGPFRQEIMTRNQLVPNQRIQMHLIKGPLKEFVAAWEFTPIGQATQVSFTAELQFSQGLIGGWFNQSMTKLCQSIVMQFCQRAEVVYG